jgi:hypothetical protein
VRGGARPGVRPAVEVGARPAGGRPVDEAVDAARAVRLRRRAGAGRPRCRRVGFGWPQRVPVEERRGVERGVGDLEGRLVGARRWLARRAQRRHERDLRLAGLGRLPGRARPRRHEGREPTAVGRPFPSLRRLPRSPAAVGSPPTVLVDVPHCLPCPASTPPRSWWTRSLPRTHALSGSQRCCVGPEDYPRPPISAAIGHPFHQRETRGHTNTCSLGWRHALPRHPPHPRRCVLRGPSCHPRPPPAPRPPAPVRCREPARRVARSGTTSGRTAGRPTRSSPTRRPGRGRTRPAGAGRRGVRGRGRPPARSAHAQRPAARPRGAVRRAVGGLTGPAVE